MIIFVHYDGIVTSKFMKCLYPNEKILIDGIRKINVDGGRSLLSPSEDNGLKKHLYSHPISESDFTGDQLYIRPLTKGERGKLEEAADMMRAIRGGGVRAFDGKW